MTRADEADRVAWLQRERESYRDRIACAHPADLEDCACCDGLCEVPHEYDSRECDECHGTGRIVKSASICAIGRN